MNIIFLSTIYIIFCQTLLLGNEIGDEGAHFLALSLKENVTLAYLSLDRT